MEEIKQIAIEGYDQGNPFKFEDILEIIAKREGYDSFVELVSND